MKNIKYDIAIVEDNPNDAELMVRTLKKGNVTKNMIVLEDGEQALNFIFCKKQFADRDPSKQPKVLFLDLKLPKVNGLEVLEQMKANDETKKIPIIIMTSSKENSDIKKAYKLGVNSYIVKPVEFNKYTDVINNVGSYWLNVNEYHQ